jgi:DNA-binding NarL/FixJ family response regulator
MKPAVDSGRKIRVGALEDDALRMVGLRTLLQDEPDMELLRLSEQQLDTIRDIDVVLLGDRTSLELFDAMDRVKSNSHGFRVLVTGFRSGDEAVLRAIAAGAKGYIQESACGDDLARAIRMVHQGFIWAPRRVLASVIDRSSQRPEFTFRAKDLTDRERKVLELLIGGRSNKEIAVPLGIEVRTVKAHIGRLMRKVGVQNRTALSVQAVSRALLSGS